MGLVNTIKQVVKCVFQYIDGICPRAKSFKWNGVEVDKHVNILEYMIPPGRFTRETAQQDRPTYENKLCELLRSHATQGDVICIVGAGHGVTSVVAANQVQDEGEVIAYEGSKERYISLNYTVKKNKVSSIVHTRRGIVGDEIKIDGSNEGAKQIHPSQIEKCNILELDCEGSEISVLTHLSYRPRFIFCETHGFLGANTKNVKNKMEKMGYTVSNEGIAEPSIREFCLEKDVFVLKGEKR